MSPSDILKQTQIKSKNEDAGAFEKLSSKSILTCSIRLKKRLTTKTVQALSQNYTRKCVVLAIVTALSMFTSCFPIKKQLSSCCMQISSVILVPRPRAENTSEKR